MDTPLDPPPSLPLPPSTPGRPPVSLSPDQRTALLEMVGNGQGIDRSLRTLGVSRRAYRNACRDVADFRIEVESARRAADEALDEVGYLAAFDVHTEAGREILFRLWDRRDRVRDLNRARRDRLRERAEDREERRLDRALRLHIAELQSTVAMAKVSATVTPAEENGSLDLSRLSPEELDLFRALIHKITGDPLPAEYGLIDV